MNMIKLTSTETLILIHAMNAMSVTVNLSCNSTVYLVFNILKSYSLKQTFWNLWLNINTENVKNHNIELDNVLHFSHVFYLKIEIKHRFSTCFLSYIYVYHLIFGFIELLKINTRICA